MPNWCENTVLMYGSKELLEDCFDKFGGNENTIDFNRIIPEPKELSEVEAIGNFTHDIQLLTKESAGEKISEKEKQYLDRVISEDGITCRENAKRAKFCLEQYGFPSWYEWRCKNWGTKWNATEDTFYYDWSTYYGKTACTFSFETPWCAAVPVIEKLATMYPELTFRLCESELSMPADNIYVFQHGHLVRKVENL